MKKFLVSAIILAMLLSLAVMPAAAIPDGCTAIDITNDVKFNTTWQMYSQALPIIRADAVYVDPLDYDMSNIVGSHGNGIRFVTISGFDDTLYKNQIACDPNYLGDSMFGYSAIWPANADSGETSKITYNIEIKEAGEYEFVFAGAAQIKTENIGNDAKDRGFCYSIDGGQKYQVNISDTPLVFNNGTYVYEYSTADAEAAIANNTFDYYQVGYAYNIRAYLSAGAHTLEYYHLEYSGETVTNTGNSSRLNFAGFYYQKYLDSISLATYTYPEAAATTEAQTTEAPVVTDAPTDAPVVTETPDDPTDAPVATDAPTDAPAATNAPAATDAPKEEGGCGGMISAGALIVTIGAAFVMIKRRK